MSLPARTIDQLSREWAIPLIALMLLNAPFWLLQQSIFITRPVLNIDLILAAFICAYSLRFGVIFILLFWVLDVILVSSLTYHFGTISEFLSSFRFGNALSFRHFITPTLGGVLVLFFIFGVIAIYVLLKSTRPARGLLVWALLIFFLDVINGSTQLFGLGKDSFRLRINLAGSPAMNLVISSLVTQASAAIPLKPAVRPVAFDMVGNWHANHPEGSLLVVIVESLGYPNATILRSWLEQQLNTPSVKSRWTMSSISENFSGGTTSGELRVLCGLAGHYARLTPNSASGCLPARLAIEGYSTTGMHGFTSQMFDRAVWWPSIGLKSQFFAEQLITPDNICRHAFTGVCDKHLIAKATIQADQSKQFVYLLTLGTHLPVMPSLISPDLQKLCTQAAIDKPACQLISQLGSVLSALASSLEGVRKPPFVAVVGDHAPPFQAIVDRMSFDQKSVPLYLLTPLN